MMENKETKPENPQAFPSLKFDLNRSKELGGTCFKSEVGGMTLRDYFAAKALTGVIHHYYASEGEEVIAKHAYEIADAMLKARENGTS